VTMTGTSLYTSTDKTIILSLIRRQRGQGIDWQLVGIIAAVFYVPPTYFPSRILSTNFLVSSPIR
jgi:hypothetical protein